MKRTSLFGLFLLLLSAFCIISCSKDDKGKISAEQIRQALFDMKGRYHGTIAASFYQGSAIVKIDNVEAISRDSLTFVMPLEPIASTITDEKVAAILRNIETVEVKAKYHFYQIDDGGRDVFFVLTPKKIIIPANGDVPDITIVFTDGYGGSFQKDWNSIVFNISPKEIFIGGTKLDSFKQLVYNYGGQYE